MRAVILRAFGGPDVLRTEDLPDPEPGPGQVAVRVRYAGVNFMDLRGRAGLGPSASLPAVPGVEGAGVVAGAGPGSSRFRPGQRVAWYLVRRSYATTVIAREDSLVPVPGDIDDATAAAVMMQGITAHHLASAYPLPPGGTALVHAAAGGVGSLLSQLIADRGGRVIGRVSTPAKAEVARRAGAADVIVDRDGGFAAEVLRLTDGQGADVVFDGVGAGTFAGSIDSLKAHGAYALLGGTPGDTQPVNLATLPRSIALSHPLVMDHVPSPARLLEVADDLFSLIRQGRLRVAVTGTFPLRCAADAHRQLESRQTTGKILLAAGG